MLTILVALMLAQAPHPHHPLVEAPRPPSVTKPFPVQPNDPTTQAFWLHGLHLVFACKSEEAADRAFCHGFIAGLDDTFELMSDPRVPLHCASGKLPISAHREAYLDFMSRHEELLAEPAVKGLGIALKEVFACGPPLNPQPAPGQPKVKGALYSEPKPANRVLALGSEKSL